MPAKFPFPLIPRFKRIQKLIRDPLSSIKAWCYDKKKTITTDPIKRKKKVIKELKLNGNNLQKVATLLGKKIDEIIDNLNGISEIEKMIIAEVKQRQQEIVRMEKEDSRIERGYKQGDRTEREYIQQQFRILKTQIDLEERNRKREDQELESKLTRLINNVKTVLTRTINNLETKHDLETKQMHATHGEDIEVAAEELKKHKYKRLSTGIGTSPVHNIGNNPPSHYKKGGTASEKEKLIQEILELQNKS